MRKNFWRCLAAAIVAYGTGCWSAEAKLFDVTEFYLDNGMQVIVIPNSKAPIVKQMVWYKAGSVDEPLGKGGLAHLLEHLMFRGTEKVPGSEFNDIVTNNGGVMNAFTSQDFTAYHEFVDVSRLELVMFLEADRMKNLNITPEAFEKERDIVYQERKQVVEMVVRYTLILIVTRSLHCLLLKLVVRVVKGIMLSMVVVFTLTLEVIS